MTLLPYTLLDIVADIIRETWAHWSKLPDIWEVKLQKGKTTNYNMERITRTDELWIYNKPNNMLNELWEDMKQKNSYKESSRNVRSEKNRSGNQEHNSWDKQQDGYNWKWISELVQIEEIC